MVPNVCHNFRPAPELRCIIIYKSPSYRQIISKIFSSIHFINEGALWTWCNFIRVNKIWYTLGFPIKRNSQDALVKYIFLQPYRIDERIIHFLNAGILFLFKLCIQLCTPRTTHPIYILPLLQKLKKLNCVFTISFGFLLNNFFPLFDIL